MAFLGFILTVVLFIVFAKLKTKIPTIITASTVIIIILKIFNIEYETYYSSAKYLSFLIAPATVALAYPLYENSDILTKTKRATYPALVFASVFALFSGYFIAKFLGAEYKVILSMLPKSTTIPIAIEISKNLGGYLELTVCTVVLTGIFGGIFGHKILKALNVKNDVATGLAIGSASHIIGTASCISKKKYKQAASSTAALILVGIFTVFLTLILKKFLII